MNLNLIISIANVFIIIGALFSVVYLFGVVWRVEKKLDISYKLILGSMIAFAISETFRFIDLGNPALMELLNLTFKVIFILLFLLGVLEVRKMLRQMDEELPNVKED